MHESDTTHLLGSHDGGELLRESEAARLIGFSQRALQEWRRRGRGPTYIRISPRAIRYQRSALAEWTRQHTVRPPKTTGARDASPGSMPKA